MTESTNLLFLLLVHCECIAAIVDPCAFSGPFEYDFFIPGIPENQPVGSVIGVLPLNGNQGEVSLTQTANPYLHLDVESRNISLIKELNTDKDDNGNKLMSDVILQVICVPTGTTRKSSLTVRVLLEDVNEHRPTFPKNHYMINLREDTPVGTVVFTDVNVTDKDGSGSGNDRIHYRILPGSYSDYFDIHILRTEVRLQKPLDYETVHSMLIEIEAKDNPEKGESLKSKAFLTFNILDVDDLNPKFTRDEYSVKLDAETQLGSIVAVKPPIRAYDGDSLNASIKYELVDLQNHFVIDATTADVSVNAKLSDGQSTLVLKATQRDNPIRQGIALLKLTIIGKGNDMGPSFAQPRYHGVVSENEAIGTTVITVTVTDHNQWTSLSYSIGTQTHFAVNNNGNIVLTRKVNYEEQRQFIFNLTASDEFYSTWTTITITVSNVNDNGPEILKREITVNTKRVKGAQIAVVKAVDKDLNTSLTYTVVTHKSLFAVSQEGIVSLTGSEGDYVSDEYIVVISVKDNGTPQRETIAVVTVAFPARVVKDTGSLDMASSKDLIAIILGVVAAILLFVIIFLVIYIIRRRRYVEEHLDRAKTRQGMDPRGLTYQRGDPSPDPSSKLDINIEGEWEETSDVDSHTTIQENPLKYRLNIARQNGDIQIETAVTPYTDNYHDYHDGNMRTFHVEENSNSDTSDSTGDSHKVLMEKHRNNPRGNANSLSWAGSNPPSSTFGSDIIAPEEQISKERPEITVYF
ncbi:cadherin-7-like isoform X2 [Ostrea edulis]|uniref:cadherin-7-like isoform X2 n=1 Tax=Ostrea edulis TaxID=37623 RepID=UPI0024AF82B6|nr:cadherin-7-like isoform X2 [Ostrea edulis]XP_056005319.1 cadherin-7-like isoform X2 [Ostrea edulis]